MLNSRPPPSSPSCGGRLNRRTWWRRRFPLDCRASASPTATRWQAWCGRMWHGGKRAQAKEDGLPDFDFRFVTGARLAFADGTPDIIAYPATRLGWGRLTRLLTTGNLRAKKGECILHLDDLLGHCEDLLLIVDRKSTRLNSSH